MSAYRSRFPSRLTARPLVAPLIVAAALLTAPVDGQEKKPGEVRRPAGNWQTPGEIQQPKGTWQTPGEIQQPGEIQRVEERCRRRLVVAADALFAFDQAALSAQAEKTLAALGPQLAGAEGNVTVEGHTDAKGSDEYNRALSERRARAVRDWLAARGHLPASAAIAGYGESKPIAANRRPDGSDDPEGREKNRRVEVVVETCPAP
jgi:outer membrane protein OmpA-like peptidoglycan-associated protein